MRLQCLEHGEVEELKLRGYSVAHEPQVKAHEKDFEGITFVVDSPNGGVVTADNIRPDKKSTERYLEKFSGWDEDIAEVVKSYYEQRRGVEEFECPHSHTGMSVTCVVDECFVPDFGENINGSFGVYDGVLEIHSLESLGNQDPNSFFEQVLDQAENENIQSVVFSTYSVDKFQKALNDLGFSVSVEEVEQGWAMNNEVLNAQIDL